MFELSRKVMMSTIVSIQIVAGVLVIITVIVFFERAQCKVLMQ